MTAQAEEQIETAALPVPVVTLENFREFMQNRYQSIRKNFFPEDLQAALEHYRELYGQDNVVVGDVISLADGFPWDRHPRGHFYSIWVKGLRVNRAR